MVDPDPSVSMQEPDGFSERGNAKPIYNTGEAASCSAIGGGAELGGKNEAPSAIGGGADLGGGNGRHATTPEGHRNEVVTMLEADTVLNEQSHWVCLAYNLNMAIYTFFTEVPMGFLVVVWAKLIVKAEQNSYLKITQVTNEMQKNLELCQIEQCILNLKKSKEMVKHLKNLSITLQKLLNTWHHNNDKRLKSKLENVIKEKLNITQSIVTAKKLLQAWDTKYLNHCPSAPVYTANVFLKLLTGGKKLGMYELKFHCPTAREQELCPWYLELWRQMPLSPFELDLYLECHPDLMKAFLEGVEMPQDRDEIHIEQTEDEQVENRSENSLAPSHLTAVAHSLDPTAAACLAPTARNVRRQLHSEDVQENVKETSQHSICRHTNVFFPCLPIAT
ncbi:hypothetical protein SELMODRAFT_432137 [Selaginella moellendorffii]|uniref:Uncharacterized protein n=1 Tax=Selaginella moellendorffii TaxID=88036 RepID=D8TF33_SELML|nr:hypothetical protein SELMODRAFT_432137 [Selaginella moellendorffii]